MTSANAFPWQQEVILRHSQRILKSFQHWTGHSLLDVSGFPKEIAQNSLLTVKNDPRRILRHIYDLFAGNCTPDEVLNIGQLEGIRGKFYSHLYLGLYYESQSNLQLAQEYIVKAADKYQIDDYMWYLAQVHKKLRGWL